MMKRNNENEFSVNQTDDPIIITGKGGGKPSGSTLIMSSDYKSYEVCQN